MRGKGFKRVLPVRLKGITPAYAGKRLSTTPTKRGIWDHPRICGEKLRLEDLSGLAVGSPPHMRGKALWATWRRFCSRDHPRICGEKNNFRLSRSSTPGSPPHMRGKVILFSVLRVDAGITPAYAGKSLLYHFFRDFARDHPRICGEKCRIIYVLVSKPGSPPHMRGKVCVASELARYSGITPAYAGKREAIERLKSEHRDHPRICGEKGQMAVRSSSIWGSPPHMRGKG